MVDMQILFRGSFLMGGAQDLDYTVRGEAVEKVDYLRIPVGPRV